MRKSVEIDVTPLQANGGSAEIPIECESEFHRHFRIYYSPTISPYSDFAPAYEYGFRMGSGNPERHFDEVEDVLKADFVLAHPNCNWDKMRRAVRYGWMRAIH